MMNYLDTITIVELEYFRSMDGCAVSFNTKSIFVFPYGISDKTNIMNL